MGLLQRDTKVHKRQVHRNQAHRNPVHRKNTLRKLGILFLLTVVIGTATLDPLVAGASALSVSHPADLDEETLEYLEEADAALQEILAMRDVYALVYLTDGYRVRRSPSTDAATVTVLSSGQPVQILGATVDENFTVWDYVSFYDNGEPVNGYIERDNLACSDEVFLEWESFWGLGTSSDRGLYALDPDAPGEQEYADINSFPESYRPALLELKERHPEWIFVRMDTGLDWNASIQAEMKNTKSLIYYTVAEYKRESAYGDRTWWYPTESTLRYYMDPRNSLTEDSIFMFEQLTYNASYHTEAAIDLMVQGSFMDSANKVTLPESAGVNQALDTYSKMFLKIGSELNVSPFHLASRVYQEQGKNGTSPLISGNYTGAGGIYVGYYNHFNVKASGATDEEEILNGLAYAKQQNWCNIYESLRGGASLLSANYISKGQYTLYLQKFNVNKNSPYGVYEHQYMQNITAPTSEAKKIRDAYRQVGTLDNSFVFSIPVFNNMPDEASPAPTATDIRLTLPSGYTADDIWVDGVKYDVTDQKGYYLLQSSGTVSKSVVAYKKDARGIPTGMYVWDLSYAASKYTATAQPAFENLLSYHGFSVRITGTSGIRFKSGISSDLKTQLTAPAGINGYRLKEYGTVIMYDSVRQNYPMIRGGEKTTKGVAYGTDSNGNPIDVVFETKDGRCMFTSVLVGLPATEYKKDFAFRSYVVLEKDGTETVIYGPILARNIYNLSKQYLDGHYFAVGSAEDLFLNQLIADADAAATSENSTEPTGSGTGSSVATTSE